jgi:hypothetical protein
MRNSIVLEKYISLRVYFFLKIIYIFQKLYWIRINGVKRPYFCIIKSCGLQRKILLLRKVFKCCLYIRKPKYEHFTPAFWQHNNLCEFTAIEHRFKRWFCTQKPVLNFRRKDFWYTKINPTHIWNDEIN